MNRNKSLKASFIEYLQLHNRSLKVSFIDGIFASTMLGFTINYIIPFALLLGAKTFQVGLLSSIPQLFSSLVQLKSAEVTERLKSRVKTITIFVILQALTWIIAFLVIFLPEKVRIETFILLVTVNTILVAMAGPPWASLMSDTVDKNKYGEYFSWRGKVLGFVNLISNFAAGLFLFVIENKLLGFITLFISAGICRIISGIYIGKMDDVSVETTGKKKFNYIEFIKRIRESNFVKFVLFVSLINFTTFIAAPFFVVYILEELKFSYFTYTIIVTISTLAGLISLPFWGRFADKFGNAKVVKMTGKLTILVPLLWLFSENSIYLIVISALAAYIWSGLNLSAVNFIFDATSSEVRTRCLAYFNFTNGIFIFFGALIGGYLATRLPIIISNSPLLTLFLLSGILRFLVNLFLGRSFREIREVSKIEDREMFYLALGIKPALSLGEEIFFRWKKRFNGGNRGGEN